MEIRELSSKNEFDARERLLARRSLKVPACDRVWGAFEDDFLLGALGSKGQTLMGLAVDADSEGSGIAVKLVEKALFALLEDGYPNVYVFTKAAEALKIKSLGFKEVGHTDKAALFEWNGRFAKHLDRLNEMAEGKPEDCSAVVMNANPFTLGHRALVEAAHAKHSFVWVFVVSEDVSEFSFQERLEMVRNGLKDMDNVAVLPAGPYMVTLATFPSYFSKEAELVETHANLDLRLFAKHAEALSVKERFIGSEPGSPSTAEYNRVMKSLLPELGVAVTEIPRIEMAGAPVSASRVRKLLREGRIEEAAALVPEINKELFVKFIEQKKASL